MTRVLQSGGLKTNYHANDFCKAKSVRLYSLLPAKGTYSTRTKTLGDFTVIKVTPGLKRQSALPQEEVQ